MGGTAAPAGLRSNDDVVDVHVEFVDRVTGGERFLVGGHSWDGYLARAVAARRRDRVPGLALICPVGRASRDVPLHAMVRTTGAPAEVLDPDDVAGFEEYFVIRTPQTARHDRDRVVPGTHRVDEPALGRIFGRWALRDEPAPGDHHPYPTLILPAARTRPRAGPAPPTSWPSIRGPRSRWSTAPATRSCTSSRRCSRLSCASGGPVPGRGGSVT